MWYNRTGQNIKIAIIDSGFPKCNGGVSVYDDIITDEDFAFDSLQHGAIIADIIDFYSPDAELYSVKIFHDDLNCSINQLEKGISWCIDHDMDIINISAAFQYEENNDNIILDFCRQATKNGILIVSAVDTQRELTIPGVLEGVIAVQNDSNLPIGKWKIAEKNKSTINANGYWNTSVIKNRAIPGSNSFGSSNSCAFVTAMIAKLLEESHDICLKNILISLKVYENIGINSYSELNKNNYALLPITPDNYYLLDFYNINRIFAFRWMGLSEQL
ncbi:MAG: S8 family serine peptidase, partial [Bacteroidales bacterium]|nr:S8 family serine peptidase [Bacteroidales bacterium]